MSGLLAMVVLVSFLPLVETNVWWVRYMDFPRLQFAVALVLLLPVYALLNRPLTATAWTFGGAALAALAYQLVILYPYTPFSNEVAIEDEACESGSALSVLIANVKKRNEDAAPFLSLVSEVEPDVLLVMETDEWWDRHLTPLAEQYPERIQHIPEETGAFGMHLLSKLPLVTPEVRFLFGAFTPTIFTGLEMSSGEVVQFVGVHPQPPMALSQPTTLRDGHLLIAAMVAGASDPPSILAGDFNAVPWEAVNRRAARIGGLLDPRIGRGLYPTFRADSLLVSWPLDQILYQEAFGLMSFEKLPDFGSDHFPVFTRLCHAPGQAEAQEAPQPDSEDIREAETSIEAARALDADGG